MIQSLAIDIFKREEKQAVSCRTRLKKRSDVGVVQPPQSLDLPAMAQAKLIATRAAQYLHRTQSFVDMVSGKVHRTGTALPDFAEQRVTIDHGKIAGILAVVARQRLHVFVQRNIQETIPVSETLKVLEFFLVHCFRGNRLVVHVLTPF